MYVGSALPSFLGGPGYEVVWLQQQLYLIQLQLDALLASLAAPAPAPAPSPPPMARDTRFVLSSFNVLSSSAGKGKGYAPGTQRIADVVKILDQNRVGVVGFQEMDAEQLKAFKRLAGDRYATVAGASGVRNYHDTTIAWRRDQWDLVQQGAITVPSYAGRDSRVPWVRLRNKATGQEACFVDAHNPANTKRYHHQERFRDAAAREEAELVTKLARETGLPVFMVGDMNAVKEAEQIFTNQAPLHAANPRDRKGIDWIFGTKEAVFSAFRRTREGLIGRTTDHPVVFTDVRLRG